MVASMVHVFVDDMSEKHFVCNGLLKFFVVIFCCHSVTSLFSMVFNWTNNVFIADQQDFFTLWRTPGTNAGTFVHQVA